MKNFASRSVRVDHFAMIPRADIPRSQFKMETTHKTTFNAGDLIPIYVDEVLPGDTFNLSMTAFCRMATPIYPVMDNLYLDTFFFFVPNRLVWDNWEKFMGSQNNPGDSISYIVPTIQNTAPYAVGSLGDYFGLPTTGQFSATNVWRHNALPFRAYNLIYNEWFRDENLQNSTVVNTGDGPDLATDYTLKKRGKRHDYFTSALPFVQKGAPVGLPLGTTAPVLSDGTTIQMKASNTPTTNRNVLAGVTDQSNLALSGTTITVGTNANVSFGNNTGLYADLSAATSATINSLRQAFQIQKLLERDARGGTRYTELIRAHFGVISPDARLQRPEYLGGGSTQVNINPIAQTSGTGASGQSAPLATLAGVATAVATGNGFSQSFTEHGYIIGLASVRADLTYQQGIRKMWDRSTRYDFYFPVFANLGEQAIKNREIYFQNVAAQDDAIFGYQERWAEYRYHPSRVSGLFRSTASGTLDGWHLAQRFTSLPTLNNTFIEEAPPMSRVLAVGAAANGAQFIFDSFFKIRAARPMPVYSVPGLVDHF